VDHNDWRALSYALIDAYDPPPFDAARVKRMLPEGLHHADPQPMPVARFALLETRTHGDFRVSSYSASGELASDTWHAARGDAEGYTVHAFGSAAGPWLPLNEVEAQDPIGFVVNLLATAR
jgi:hypothetical protein